ncbi:MAG TPA: ABC transporter permease [Magnetospirillaceae bacterium]|jgi:ribose transport system permease protein
MPDLGDADAPAAAAVDKPAPWTALKKYNLPAFIVLLAIITGVLEPKFWSGDNMRNLLLQISPLLVITAGQSFAVIGGGLDLSVSAILAAAGVGGLAVMNQIGIIPGVIGMPMVGAAIGLVNGLIITRFRLSPFVVTLGMLSICRGATLVATAGLPVYDIPSRFLDIFGDGRILGLPVGGIIAILCIIGCGFLLHNTVFGRYVYAVGANPIAAYNSGVNVQRITLGIYVITGLTSGIAAIVLTSWVAAAQPLAGSGLELQSLAAVVIGGAALTGGSGSMMGVVYGVVILGILSNGLNMVGVSSFYQTMTIGIIIVVAVILDRLRGKA